MAEVRSPLVESTVYSQPIFRISVRQRIENPTSERHQPRLTRLYFLTGTFSTEQVVRLANALLVDPVTESFDVQLIDQSATSSFPQPLPASFTTHSIDVTLLPGVTDSVAQSIVRAAHQLGFTALERAASGQHYDVDQPLTADALEQLASSLFNPVIQRVAIDRPIAPPFVFDTPNDLSVEVIALRDTDDARLRQIGSERRLALDMDELRAIRAYFQQEGRDPTDAELEMLAQTWSEHCVHKTFKAQIDYNGPTGSESIDGLLKTTIRAATEQVDKPWVHSAFVDNAGIIAFDGQYDVAFKVETHNHPSALEPFGGANTGLGGVIRDVLGVSAKPIASTDVLCFGWPDTPPSALPTNVLPPGRVAEGVIHGIEDYGNKMGIPTVNGAIFYHDGYTANPLVFAGSLGLLPHGSHRVGAKPGDLIVVIGGRTGRDGLRGATFSSMEMDTTTGTLAGSAVQIGNPIEEKQVQEALLKLRDAGLYDAITDCGAGGLSSSVGEMAADLGARVQLETVPLKYSGLRPWEIWLSEAQERMVLAVPPEHWPQVQTICDGVNVEACNIGTFEATNRLRLLYEGQIVGDISLDFLHDGLPRRHLKAEWQLPAPAPLELNTIDPRQALLDLLAHPNIRSKESVIRRYDHEVQGGTAVKPLVGVDNHGPADAAVVVPNGIQRTEHPRGVALSAGMCPQYSAADPYAMAWAAIDEAFRNLVAVGADPDRVALLDNFCWGNPNLPDRLGALVRCAQGCYDAAMAYQAPFISGKDSLNNEYTDVDGQRHAIPGTLLISALGLVPDVVRTATSDLKRAGDLLYLVGTTRDDLGQSHLALMQKATGGTVPQPTKNPLPILRAVHQAISAGLVQACHDCSEGGLAVALAEMSIGGRLGAALSLRELASASGIDNGTTLLFAESLTRFLIEVRPEDRAAFETLLSGLPAVLLGQTDESGSLKIQLSERELLSVPVTELEQAWRGTALTSRLFAASGSGQPKDAGPLPPSPRRRGEPETLYAASPRGEKRVLILHANGTNRDHDAALACELAGATSAIVHVNQLISCEVRLADYHMLVVPGGFSYGDDLGAGVLWALDLQHQLGQQIERFIADGRPVLGICNGFQALVKSGLLPGADWFRDDHRTVTLTYNESAHFECRWVTLQPNPNSPCLFTEGLTEPIYCPVAHGEGRLTTVDAPTADALWTQGLAPLTYVGGEYPLNPNGSTLDIAGLCNAAGNVFGLMPHPENHVFPWQHPRWHRGERGMGGLRLFQNGVRHA